MKLVFLLLLSTSLSSWQYGVDTEAAISFFEAFYAPVVKYDAQGLVLNGGSPLTAGHIRPDWNAAVSRKVGKGKKSCIEFQVPISVEREIWTTLAEDQAERYPVKELAEPKLVLTCREKDSVTLWDAVIRYRIVDPKATGKRRFSGLIIDVDPNTFNPVSLKEYRNGTIVLNESNLDGYRWIHKRIPTPVESRFNNNEPLGYDKMRALLQTEPIVTGYNLFMPNAQPLYSAAARYTSYVQVLSLPEVRNAINRYRYYPVTIKQKDF